LFLYIFLTFFCLIFIHAPIITLFPYTTLFRSRVYFNNIICSIPLYIFHIFPIGRLFSTNTRNPYFKPLYGTMQRFNFAYITTFRSEEHTSELQSRENLVCRLLLEKKNNNKQTV